MQPVRKVESAAQRASISCLQLESANTRQESGDCGSTSGLRDLDDIVGNVAITDGVRYVCFTVHAFDLLPTYRKGQLGVPTAFDTGRLTNASSFAGFISAAAAAGSPRQLCAMCGWRPLSTFAR